MALKVYVVNGATFQFTEGEQPEGAVEFEPAPAVKSVGRPQNKQAPRPVDK